MNSIVVAFITSLLLLLFAERMVGVFFEERRTSLPVMYLTYAGVFALLIGTTLFSSPQMHRFHFAIIFIYDITLISAGCLILSFNYKSSAVRRWVATLSALPVFFLANIWATFVVRIIYINNYSITEDFGVGMVLILTSLIAALAAALLHGFKNIKRNAAISPMVLIIIVMVMFALFISYFFLTLLSPRAEGADSMHVYMVVFIHTIPTGFIILLFYILDTIAAKHEDKIKSALQAQEKEYYYAQCQLMQASVENIKSLRHDMKLHLATARDFISTDKTDEATAYLTGLLGNIEESDAYSNTQNTAFDSIINFKLNNAKDENIKLDIRLLIPPALNIEVADIVTIIGNLLDNALDAVAKVEDRRIKLDIEYSRESLFIQVENTFDGVVKYNIEDKRISTRKNSGEHGHGLKNIRKSVEKYNGHIDIAHDENIFTVTVLLYVDDMQMDSQGSAYPLYHNSPQAVRREQ